MSSRTLVIQLGQLRAHQLTWNNFKDNVLDQLGADLAVCVPNDAFFDFTNPYYMNAKFRWLVPDAPDLADTFDRIQRSLGSSEHWRVLCDVKGSWLGRIAQSNQPGAAAILFVLRWFMLNNVQAQRLIEIYDRFVVTRSDFYYFCPHPPLDCLDARYVWIPDGADWGGLCDRHLVVSSADLVPSCNLIDDMLLRPQQLHAAMIGKSNWNIEKFILQHFTRNGLITKVKRFPYIMFLVRVPEDPTAWSTGKFVSHVGMAVKYLDELREAERYRELIQSNDDWRLYFASEHFSDLLPLRIYSSHGTVLYVDETTAELRHGAINASPANVFFFPDDSYGRIVHISEGRVHDMMYFSDRTKSSLAHSTSDNFSMSTVRFRQVSAYEYTGYIGLRAEEIYLCAEPDGRIVLNRPHCSTWEYFRLIPNFHDRRHMGYFLASKYPVPEPTKNRDDVYACVFAQANTTVDSGHHPIFSRFERTQPFNDERYHHNFMGARIAHEFERDLVEIVPQFGPAAKDVKASGRSTRYDNGDQTYPYKNSEDYFEWIDLLTAIDRSTLQFTMIEVGAGYGRWIANAAAALKRRKNRGTLQQKFIALEANKARFDLLIKNCEQNAIPASEIELLRGACTGDGSPVLMKCNEDYGTAVFRNDTLMSSFTGDQISSGGDLFERVPGFRLDKIIEEQIDFLDMDIQGAELDVIPECINSLDRFVKMIHVATHSAVVDEKLSHIFHLHGWAMRYSFPCWQINKTTFGVFQFVDGIQSWENLRLG